MEAQQTRADEADENQTAELPHPSEDPTLAYVHEGKKYTLPGSDLTFEVVDYDADTKESLDGLVTIQSTDGSIINSEHRHQNGGVSKEALDGHIPDENDRAVWTATGILNQVRELEILEEQVGSYRDYYWSRQD